MTLTNQHIGVNAVRSKYVPHSSINQAANDMELPEYANPSTVNRHAPISSEARRIPPRDKQPVYEPVEVRICY